MFLDKAISTCMQICSRLKAGFRSENGLFLLAPRYYLIHTVKTRRRRLLYPLMREIIHIADLLRIKDPCHQFSLLFVWLGFDYSTWFKLDHLKSINDDALKMARGGRLKNRVFVDSRRVKY